MSLDQGHDYWSSKIGESVIGEWHEMTQDRIDKFAEATGDHQWIHVDPERSAIESPYGGTIAHGFLTLSLIPLLIDDMSPDQIPVEGITICELWFKFCSIYESHSTRRFGTFELSHRSNRKNEKNRTSGFKKSNDRN